MLARAMKTIENESPVLPNHEIEGLEVFHTGYKNIGLGVRTNKFIEKGSFVATYLGEICVGLRPVNGTYVMGFENGIFVDAIKYGNIGRWINHDCGGGNLVLQKGRSYGYPTLYFIARRDIDKGMELKYTYKYRFPGYECDVCASQSSDLSAIEESDSDWEEETLYKKLVQKNGKRLIGNEGNMGNSSSKRKNMYSPINRARTCLAEKKLHPLAPVSSNSHFLPLSNVPINIDETRELPIPNSTHPIDPLNEPSSSLMLPTNWSSDFEDLHSEPFTPPSPPSHPTVGVNQPESYSPQVSDVSRKLVSVMVSYKIRALKVYVKRLSPLLFRKPCKSIKEGMANRTVPALHDEILSDSTDREDDEENVYENAEPCADPRITVTLVKGEYRAVFPQKRLNAKLRKRYTSYKYKCIPCEFGTNDASILQQHKTKFHAKFTKKFKCVVTGCKNKTGFPDISSINQHLSNVHKEVPVLKRGKARSSRYQCKFCQTNLASQFTLDRHLERRLLSKKNICKTIRK